MRQVHSAPLTIADDLTGALSSAASIRAAGIPSAVVWNELPEPSSRAVVVNARTRDTAAVFGVTAKWAEDGLRKGYRDFELRVDTALRGDPAAGIRAIASNLESEDPIAIAIPAFPAAGRETRNGVQRILQIDGSWSEIEVAERVFPGRQPRLISLPGSSAETPYAQVLRGMADGAREFVADAASDDDLQAWAADIARMRSEGIRLITVSSGAWFKYLPAPATYVMVVAGSDSPVLAEQTERLKELQPDATVRDLGHGIEESDLEVAESEKVVFVLSTPRVDGSSSDGPAETARDPEHARRLAADARRLMDLLLERQKMICRGIVVSGGWAAEMLLDELEGEALETVCAPAPLCTVARIRGGPYRGTPILAKGGSIGHPELFIELIKEMWKEQW